MGDYSYGEYLEMFGGPPEPSETYPDLEQVDLMRKEQKEDPPPHSCDKELRARPDFSQFTGTPAEFTCSCGKRWAHAHDEAEGDYWGLVV